MANIINEEFKPQQTLSTGINILDKKINSLHNGEVILYAGRPDMGQHSLALKCAYQNALFFQQQNSKKNVLYLNSSLFTKNDLVKMLLEQPQKAIKSQIDSKKMYFTINHVEKLPLYFYGSVGTIDNLRKIIYQFVASSVNIGLIIIEDWLLIRANTCYYDKELVASKIKEISSDLNIPIILTSILYREVEYRLDKRPILNDISESYGDALKFINKIIFLYRDVYYLKQIKIKKFRKGTQEQYEQRLDNWKKACNEAKNKCELIIAKNTIDYLGTVLCYYNHETKVIKDSEVPF